MATIQENKTGIEIMKRFKNEMHRRAVTEYYKDNKLYLVNYEDRDKETMSLNQINRYRCPNRDKNTNKRIARLSIQSTK